MSVYVYKVKGNQRIITALVDVMYSIIEFKTKVFVLSFKTLSS